MDEDQTGAKYMLVGRVDSIEIGCSGSTYPVPEEIGLLAGRAGIWLTEYDGPIYVTFSKEKPIRMGDKDDG